MRKSDKKKKGIIWQKILDNKLFILGVLLMLLICLIHTFKDASLANFVPINGTFQNYNPVRRFLAGQVPFKEYADYLGLGHLYLGTLFTVLFGGTYQSSLYAYTFLTFFGFALFIMLISWSVLRNKEKAIIITTTVLTIILIIPIFFENILANSDGLLKALRYSLLPGNSARMMRGTILVHACILIYLGYLIYTKWIQKKEVKFKKYLPYFYIAIVAGMSFCWSNDYGIGSWLCLILMNAFLALSRERKITFAIGVLLSSILVSFVSLFLVVEILTFGNFKGWITFTFGTGGYQSWFFNNNYYRSYYLFDVDFSFIMLVQGLLVLLYLKKLFDAKGTAEACKRYGILAFINMSCFAVVNEYRLISNGQLYEVSFIVLLLTISVELFNVLNSLFESQRLRRNLVVGSVVLSLAWVSSTMKDLMTMKVLGQSGLYVPQMGGYMTTLNNDLYAAHAFLNGEDFFATYATAQELMEGKFQPTGIDYIIHALGDKQRQAYLDAFKNGTFKYAATIRDDYTDWSFWMKRANWFFYRELYQSWHPVFANTYETYWERNADGETTTIHDGFTLKVTEISATSQKIEVICNDSTVNGIADVYVDYRVEKKGNLSSKVMFRRELEVKNTGKLYPVGGLFYDHNHLRPISAEYIPVEISNGRGEVTITSQPSHSTVLNVNEAKCDAIYGVSSRYIPLLSTNVEKNQFIIQKYARYVNDTAEAKKVIYHGKEYTVTNISPEDDGVYITVEETIEEDDNMENFIQIR